MNFLNDANNWVAFSFVIFVVLFAKFGWKQVAAKLDGRIDEIRNELDQAQKLRLEAEAMLADYQRRHADAMKEAAEIAARAKAQAQAARTRAEEELKENQARREKQLDERLKRMEQAAQAELRQITADIAMRAAEELVKKSLDAKAQSALADKAIANIGASLN